MKKYRIYRFPMIVLAIFILGGCVASFEDGNELAEVAKTKISEMPVDSLIVKLENYEPILLLDVRQSDEFAKGNIPGSVLLSRGELEFKISNEPFWEEMFLYSPLPEEEIVIYCKSGARAALAAESLQKLGFSNVYSLQGGYQAYQAKTE